MNIFFKFNAYLRLREAIIMADKAHEKDGDRYFVMPSTNGQLIVMDRKNFKILRRKGYVQKKVYAKDLYRECFYFTNKGYDNTISEEQMKVKRKEYYSWCDAMRKLKKHRKNKK